MSKKNIICVTPDWLVLIVDFFRDLDKVLHFYVSKQRNNRRNHCFTINFLAEIGIRLKGGGLARTFQKFLICACLIHLLCAPIREMRVLRDIYESR